MLIQFLLIVGVVGLFVAFARREHGVAVRAWKRVAFAVFVLLNIGAILRPDQVTWVANRLGVGRGADLLLYALVVTTVFWMMNTHLHFRSVQRELTDLARAIALRDAERNNAERLGLGDRQMPTE